MPNENDNKLVTLADLGVAYTELYDRDIVDDDMSDIATALELIAVNDERDIRSYSTIRKIVREGNAEKYFAIGDRLSMPWSDGTTTYDLPWDVVNIANVVNEKGDSVPGLWLQAHWALPGVQFDGNEAFYHCDETLPSGTYNIIMGNSWGSNVVSGKTYQFTLTQNVPAGGQLVFTTASSTTSGLPDQSPSNWRVGVTQRLNPRRISKWLR